MALPRTSCRHRRKYCENGFQQRGVDGEIDCRKDVREVQATDIDGTVRTELEGLFVEGLDIVVAGAEQSDGFYVRRKDALTTLTIVHSRCSMDC